MEGDIGARSWPERGKGDIRRFGEGYRVPDVSCRGHQKIHKKNHHHQKNKKNINMSETTSPVAHYRRDILVVQQ